MLKKTSSTSNKVKAKSTPKKPAPKTDADKIRALEEQLAQREAELAVINSIQTALASKMDFQGIIDAVGDKLGEIFRDGNVGIGFVEETRNVVSFPYVVENGKRLDYFEIGLDVPSVLVHSIKRRRPLVINKNISKRFRTEVFNFPGQDQRDLKAWLSVPLISGDKFLGGIALRNWQRENAYSESDVRLLQTIANSMSVALENVRLFDETQHLLKETEKRTIELQIINNIGQTLTEGLDLQSTIEHVGERLQDILKVQSIAIAVSTPEVDSILAQYIYHKGQRIEPNEDTAENFKFAMRFAARWAGKSWVASTSEKYLEKYIRKFAILGLPKSFAAFPLLSGGEVIGGITIADDEREDAFTDLPIDMLETISSNMGTAIQNVRLFDETQRLLKETEQRATELQIVNNIGQTLTEGLDLHSTLEYVTERLREVLGVEYIGITIAHPNTDIIIAQYFHSNHAYFAADRFSFKKYRMGIRMSMKGKGRSWVAKTNVEKSWHKFAGDFHTDDPVPKSFILLPLLAGNDAIGGITIADYENENAFDDVSTNLLETIAANLGTAIQNTRLFDETQRLLKQTEQRATELQIINNVGQTITGELDLNTLIEHVGDKLREAFNVGNIRIAVVDEKTGLLISPYVYRHGKRVELEENWQEKAERYKLAMRASVRTGLKTWVVNNNAEKSWRKFASVVDAEDVPKSFVMLPLLAGTEVIGGITIPNYEEENAFSDFSIGMLETIASNMGTAIQNVRLFEETKRLFKEAEEARAAAEQANKAKSTFLANMSHELRTPLNAIMGFTQIVKGKAEGALPEKQIGNLDKVLTSSQHLLGLINTVLDIAKIEAGRMDVIPGKFSLNGFAEQCMALATPLLKPEVTLEKQVDETIGFVYSDQDKIKQIILNLLSNAAKFTHKGKIVLKVEKLAGDMISIAVKDSGIGISKEAVDRVFEEFQQAETTTTR
ncbi:MAG: GAF domain-containing protein [Anaerolineales bacterium]|nr:GAF domain-containing protein [Anaerolineales bacterium]